MALLLAGGARDPNLRALARRAHLAGIPVVAALTAPGHVPRICGDPQRGELRLEGTPVRVVVGAEASPTHPRRHRRSPSALAPEAETENVEPAAAPVVSPPIGTSAPATGGHGSRAAWPVAAVFLRGDVFGQGQPGNGGAPHGVGPSDADKRLHADYPALQAGFLALLRGWLARMPGVGQFNRDPFGRSRSVNKFAALHAAARAGLPVPDTRSGNDPETILEALDAGAMVQKPFRGGNYCCPLTKDHVRTHMAAPRDFPVITAQSRLVPPELRVFRAGDRLLGYTVHSPALDYRTDGGARILPCDVPRDLAGPLMVLTDEMGLDWCASDFKQCPRTGRLLYLETNANPMFAAFDRAGGGDLADAILAALGLVTPRHATQGAGPGLRTGPETAQGRRVCRLSCPGVSAAV